MSQLVVSSRHGLGLVSRGRSQYKSWQDNSTACPPPPSHNHLIDPSIWKMKTNLVKSEIVGFFGTYSLAYVQGNFIRHSRSMFGLNCFKIINSCFCFHSIGSFKIRLLKTIEVN